MKNEVRFRINAGGIQYFNPTNREWVNVKDSVDYQELFKLVYNVTKNYPEGEEVTNG